MRIINNLKEIWNSASRNKKIFFVFIGVALSWIIGGIIREMFVSYWFMWMLLIIFLVFMLVKKEIRI